MARMDRLLLIVHKPPAARLGGTALAGAFFEHAETGDAYLPRW